MVIILGVVLLIVAFAVGMAFVAYQIFIWTAAIILIALAGLTMWACSSFGIDDPKSVFFLGVLPAAAIGLVVWGYILNDRQMKEEAERKAKELAERLAREAAERKRQAELAKLSPVDRWVKRLFG